MARPKAFNPDEALERAMEVFWAQGFDNTSMQDLVGAMGINRGSLYDTFGDKHSLYLASLDRYLQQHSVRLAASDCCEQTPARDIIGAIFNKVIDHCGCDGNDRGCMITNTICELCTRDDVVADRLKQTLLSFEDMLCTVIRQGQENGSVAAEKDPRALARFMLNTLQGMQVMRKIAGNRESLRQVADQALHCLN